MLHAPPAPPAPRTLLPLRAGEGSLALIALVGLTAATVVALRTGGHEFLFYIAVVAVLMLSVWALHRRYPLSHASLWALLAWAVVHMLGGMVPMPAPTGVLYNFWLVPDLLKYDQLVHAYGFGVTAWVAWQCLRHVVAVPAKSWLVLTAAALSAMGLGALNEEVEFAATKLVERTNVGGYENNAWDLVFNMLGAVGAVLLIRVWGPAEAHTTA